MKHLILFFLITLEISSFGQSFPKSQLFKYVPEEPASVFDIESNSQRIFLNDSVFVDYGILCSDDTAEICSITFKKIKSNWFIKANNEWQEFFNSTDSLIKVVYFKNEKFILKPIGHSIDYNDIELFGFIKEDLYVYVSDINTFWFEPNSGIVIIDGGNKFIRNDFVKK